MRWIPILLALGWLVGLGAGCGGTHEATRSDHVTDGMTGEEHPVLPNDGTRMVGDATRCPVSGEAFTVTELSPSVAYEGGTYYFCCPGCVKDFNADPAKYLGKE